jgi:hypothetical protein
MAAAGAGTAVLMALGLVLWRGGAVPRGQAATTPPRAGPLIPSAAPARPDVGTIPDISGLTPRERFDRLYAKILEGLRTGDTMALSRFAPMALGAYEMLDSTEADSTVRRQAALLRLHLGDTTVTWPARGR